jgi:hypothetical protein
MNSCLKCNHLYVCETYTKETKNINPKDYSKIRETCTNTAKNCNDYELID